MVATSVVEIRQAKNLNLAGISYDPKDKMLGVFFEDLEPLINKPQEICVKEENGGVNTIRVTDGTGLEHFIKLVTPVAV